MTFTLLPAVDVTGGMAVRPATATIGVASTAAVSGDRTHGDGTHGDGAGIDPRTAALRWQAEGAEWVHLVDLDAAFGRGSNAELLGSLIDELDVHVELSGGIADAASLGQALATGCERVIIATQGLADMDWCVAAVATHGERVAVAVDVRINESGDGTVRHRLAARGSTDDAGDLWEALTQLDTAGCARYVVTDVTRDAMLNGPNLQLCAAVAAATSAQVIASGGVSSITDLVDLAELATTNPNLEGSIVGTALYAGRFTLPEALAAVQRVVAR